MGASSGQLGQRLPASLARPGFAFALAVAALCLAIAALGPGAADASPAAISLRPSRGVIRSSHHVSLSGNAAAAPAGATVDLYASPYPYTRSSLLASAPVSAAGGFSFVVSPDRNSRYRAVLVGTPEQAQAQVLVSGDTVTRVTALTLGRAEVTILVFHPRDLRWNGAIVKWLFASGARGPFLGTSPTRTRRLSRYVTLVRTIVTLPAGRFRFRACFHAPADHALANLSRPPGCTGRGYHGGGSLPVGFPGPAAIARAEGYLSSRSGRTGLAVIDSEGRLSGVNVHAQFITGSVVKAMLLVAYLRHLDAIGQHYIDAQSASFLYPMIHVSDNNAASQTMSYVGAAGLYGVARTAGMTDFYVADSAPGDWGTALLSPADQARFFFAMDSLIPREFVGYARFLLSTIAAYESWGIPAVARPLGYRVFFKGGWRPSPDIYLVNQIARLEGHHRTFSMAVMTDGDADMGYGIGTIQGVTAALLR
ncbi:MAG: hypothetical protein ACR2MK_03330 [Solirubrobacteraceae bacterium]